MSDPRDQAAGRRPWASTRVVFLFIVPWVGIPAGIVGLALAVFWIAGFGRRAAARDEPLDKPGV